MAPAYTSLTVLAAKVGGTSQAGFVWAVRFCNLVLACGSMLMLRALTRRLTGSPEAATLASLGIALYLSAIYVATQVSAANLYVPLYVALLVALLAAGRSASWSRWALAGLVAGVLSLARAEMAPLLPLVVAWLWWAAGRSNVATRGDWQRRSRCSHFSQKAADFPPSSWRRSRRCRSPTTTSCAAMASSARRRSVPSGTTRSARCSGTARWWRTTADRQTKVLVAGFLVVSSVIPTIFFALARFRLPIEVMLLAFAASWAWTRAEPSQS